MASKVVSTIREAKQPIKVSAAMATTLRVLAAAKRMSIQDLVEELIGPPLERLRKETFQRLAEDDR